MNARDRIAAVRSHLIADPGLWSHSHIQVWDGDHLKEGCLGYLLEWVSPSDDAQEARELLAITAGMPPVMAAACPFKTIGEWNDEFGRTVRDVIDLCEKALATWKD